MNLLYLHNTRLSHRNANVVQVLNMCHAFSLMGVNVTLATPEDELTDTEERTLLESTLGSKPSISTVKFKKLGGGKRLNVLGSFFGVRELLKRVDADVIFTRDPLMMTLALRSNKPIVYEAHSKTVHEKIRIMDSLWINKIVRNSKWDNLVLFVAISEKLANVWIDRGVRREKIVVLHDGYNPLIFNNKMLKADARSMLNLSQESQIVTYAGSLYANRGIERVLEIAKVYPFVQFLIVGGTLSEVEQLRRKSEKQGIKNIEIVGRVPSTQVAMYLRASDVLLMLWTWRVKTIGTCSPLKVFEYMACERLIVGENFPTIGEILKHGDSALLCKPGDHTELVEMVGRALREDNVSAISKRAFEESKKYTWQNRAKIIYNVINK